MPKTSSKVNKFKIIDNLHIKSKSVEKRLKVARAAMGKINLNLDRNVIVMGDDKSLDVERVSFGCEKLNELTNGGLPKKRFSVIYGAEKSGKTTTIYNLIASAQKQGLVCYLIDMEKSYDASWASKQGVDIQNLLVGKGFITAEEVFDSIVKLSREKKIDFIVLDSIHGLSPKGESESKKGVEKSIEEDTMALLARRLSKFFRISAPGIYAGDVTMVLIGQTRMDLGKFIVLETLQAGRALSHWASMVIHVRRGKKANAPRAGGKKDGDLAGFELVAKIEKSKVGQDEGRVVSINFLFGEGLEGKNNVAE